MLKGNGKFKSIFNLRQKNHLMIMHILLQNENFYLQLPRSLRILSEMKLLVRGTEVELQ